ncbi:hypothetical protein KJ855_04565 [Patescibacteria group bacterium]|nr:hypothetical protein [Patescibacteria group bacterium]
MVVIAIIGILAVVALGIVRGAQQRAKDAALQATVANITTAMETYYTIAGTYPADSASFDDLWNDADNKVLDKAPALPAGCDEGGLVDGYFDSEPGADDCGIGIDSADDSYTIYVHYVTGDTEEYSGGTL